MVQLEQLRQQMAELGVKQSSKLKKRNNAIAANNMQVRQPTTKQRPLSINHRGSTSTIYNTKNIKNVFKKKKSHIDKILGVGKCSLPLLTSVVSSIEKVDEKLNDSSIFKQATTMAKAMSQQDLNESWYDKDRLFDSTNNIFIDPSLNICGRQQTQIFMSNSIVSDLNLS